LFQLSGWKVVKSHDTRSEHGCDLVASQETLSLSC